jgi:hypothetical protein
MKELITSGFPRSGSTYLNQALQLLYYPLESANLNRHSVVSIEKSVKIMVPFRNPLDAIVSWHKYPSDGILEEDIAYYIRFYSYVLENLPKVVLMDFDLFTQEIDYIKSKVRDNFGISTEETVTDSQIKETMINNHKDLNLPRNNKDELDEVKLLLKRMPNFEHCLNLYVRLKEL